MLIKDRLPAYISWEIYERNLAQVTANRNAHQGIARGGMALLTGSDVRGQGILARDIARIRQR